jgi:hypothetical protein
MKSFGKIAGINLAIVLAYSALARLLVSGTQGSNDRSMGLVLFSAFAVGAHVIVCVGAMIGFFASGNGEKGRSWLATAGLVLLIGFSVCLGNASLG